MQCEEGGAAVGALASSEEAINGQAGLLVAGVCPQAPDPAYCAASLPGFWASLGPIIMVEHFKHICDDMEQCKPPPPPLGTALFRSWGTVADTPQVPGPGSPTARPASAGSTGRQTPSAGRRR